MRSPLVLVAVAVASLAAHAQPSVVQISAGDQHTCALTAASRVLCWGFDEYGQLGDGTFGDYSGLDRVAPVEVVGLSRVKSVSAGSGHTCALTQSGRVKCWGDNKYGQLGDGSTERRAVPVDVKGIPSVAVSVAAGFTHSCAVIDDGRVFCWGLLRFELTCTGQGWGPPVCTQYPVIHGPEPSEGITNATAIVSVAGGDGFCAFTADRRALCVPEPEGTDVSGLAFGTGHRCILHGNSVLTCSGLNGRGQLGDGTYVNSMGVEVTPRLSGIPAAVSAGGEFSCALQADGRVFCWGLGDAARTGRTDTLGEAVPGEVQGIGEPVVALSSGRDHSCAITSRGGVRCWGAARLLGDGTRIQRSTAVAVIGLEGTQVPFPQFPAWFENPAPGSFQSGIGVISGWSCEGPVSVTVDGKSLSIPLGGPRADTASACAGRIANGFGLLVNYNNFGAGTHVAQLYVNGIARGAAVPFTVTIPDGEFLSGVSKSVVVPDFPSRGRSTTLAWQESQQNFAIRFVSASPTTGSLETRLNAGPPGATAAWSSASVLENPAPGSYQSGIGLISGWSCEGPVAVTIDGMRIAIPHGGPRADTQSACAGNSSTGFGVLVNYNNFAPGTHTAQLYIAGSQVGPAVPFTVASPGGEFMTGLARTVSVPDFPTPGRMTTLVWQESQQNFAIQSVTP